MQHYVFFVVWKDGTHELFKVGSFWEFVDFLIEEFDYIERLFEVDYW